MARRPAAPDELIRSGGRRATVRAGSTRSVLHRLMGAYAARRHAVLFYMLLLTLAAGPLLTAFKLNGDLLQILLAFTILFALVDVPRSGVRVALMIIGAVTVGLRVAPLSVIGTDVATGALIVGSAIALLAATGTVRFAMRTAAVDAEHIYAALSAYMIAGVFFGVLDWAIEIAWPGSLGSAAAADASGLSLSTAIYFSFVTLATLGYGDVVPRTELSRGVAVLEAVGGQLYIAVMIARLVGAHLQTAGPRDEPGRPDPKI